MTRRPLIVFVFALSVLLFLVEFSFTVHAQSGITSPASGSTVSGDVPIIGTAVIEPFQRYELYYKQEPSGDDAYIYFDGGTNQVVNGQLAIWRTNDFAPGTYSLRLRVVKTDGNYGEFFVRDLVVNQSPGTPSPTPTSSEPTPTPIPSATFTPGPQPTPIVGQVTQPQLEGEANVPTPTVTSDGAAVVTNPESGGEAASGDTTNTLFATPQDTVSAEAATSFTRDLGEAVALNRLRTYFLTGIRLSATLILGVVVLLAGKRLFGWFWTQYR
jgi:hypothetical protein